MGRRARFTIVAFLTAACGTSVDDPAAPGTTSEPVTNVPASEITAQAAPGLYVVVGGDTLYRIAKSQCGDRRAAGSIFQANVGRLQPDGDAFSDPNLIRVGWQFVIDCTVVETEPQGSAVPITEAETPITEPTTPTTIPPLNLAPVADQRQVIARERQNGPSWAPTSVDIPHECLGSTTQPVLRPDPRLLAVIANTEIGGDNPTRLTYGSYVEFDSEGFSAGVSTSLTTIEGRPVTGFEFVADVGQTIPIELPTGGYWLVVSDGQSTGRVAFQIVSRSELALQRHTADLPTFDVLGAEGRSLELAIYVKQTSECDAWSWIRWAPGVPLAISEDGTARFHIDHGDAPEGVYCVVMRGQEAQMPDVCDSQSMSLG